MPAKGRVWLQLGITDCITDWKADDDVDVEFSKLVKLVQLPARWRPVHPAQRTPP